MILDLFVTDVTAVTTKIYNYRKTQKIALLKILKLQIWLQKSKKQGNEYNQ